MSAGPVDDEISSAYEGLTALPRWEGIQSPKRALTRHGSRDRILEKNVYTREADLGATGDRSGAVTPADSEDPHPSRMIIWLVLAVVVLLVLAIVLGAVLGTFLNPSGNSAAPQPSITEIPAGTTPTPTASPTPTGDGNSPTPPPYEHIPSLAVTGWTVPGSDGYYTVWMFSQDEKGYLSSHSFNSSTGNWTRVSNFASAKPGTPLAATAINTDYYADNENYTFPGTHYQVSVVYLTKNGYLNEWTWPDNGPDVGQPGSLNDMKYIAHEDTDLAYYWPSLVYQGMSGEIREAHFECFKRNECWNDNVYKTTEARNGTRLVTVPMRNELASTGLFYEEVGGRYVNYMEDHGDGSVVWTNQAFAHQIPSNASITAFSTRRSGSDTNLNTYLLWQDTNGTIQTSWTNSAKGWTGPTTYPAFNGADNNTALTCSTGLTFPGFSLPTGTEPARCYFQTGGAVREVSFDGTHWDVVDNVPTFGF